MSMSRVHYTELAEFVGQIAAGEILPDEAIDELAILLRDLPGNYKEDKFRRHAEKEVAIIERERAHHNGTAR